MTLNCLNFICKLILTKNLINESKEIIKLEYILLFKYKCFLLYQYFHKN